MDYWDNLEMSFYFQELSRQVTTIKDENEFYHLTSSFFDNLISQGENYQQNNRKYEYIIATHYNRQTFINYLLLVFENLIKDNVLITLNEMSQLIGLLCLNFDHVVIEDAAYTLTLKEESNFVNIYDMTFEFSSFIKSICFHIMYNFWLSIIKKLFQDTVCENKLSSKILKLSIKRLKLDKNASTPIGEEMLEELYRLLDSAFDVSFLEVKQNLLKSFNLKDELMK